MAVDLDAGAAAPATRVFQLRDGPAAGEACADTQADAGSGCDPDPLTSEAGTTRTIVDGSGDDRAGGANGTICVDGVGFGTYRLIEAVVPDGYFGDGDTEELAVVSPSTCAQRLDTTGAPRAGQAIDATFVNPRGAFLIRNQDDRGDLLGGATFAISPDPRTQQAGSTLAMIDSDGTGWCASRTCSSTGRCATPTSPLPATSPRPGTQGLHTRRHHHHRGHHRTRHLRHRDPRRPRATFTNTRGKGGKQ